MFTDLDLEEIKKMESVKGRELNEVKKILADEVTGIVHGKDCLAQIHRATQGMFGNSKDDLSSLDSAPCLTKPRETSIVDILVESAMSSSRGDAKRLLRGSGVCIDGQTVDENYKIPSDLPSNATLKLSCGKKKRLLIVVE
jgi:tyrosyl-tRNA synthetase